MTWLLEMKNITKTFGAVKAVDNVSLRLNAGEVVSLCGENGSGKSTLMKVLCGIYPHGSYEGEIIFAGETLQANHIRDTERKGIAIIHQGAGAGETSHRAGEYFPRRRDLPPWSAGL